MASLSESDLTIVYYSANVIPLAFASKVYEQLLKAAQGQEIIAVTQKKMLIDEKNLVVNLPHHHLSIYRQALLGAREANTKYVAFAEDDVLYSPEHFKRRPTPNKFAYNLGTWNLYTWGEPIFSHKERRNMHGLICERELFIEAMEERFRKHWKDEDINLSIWAEPGKYEGQLGVTVRETEVFYTNPPNIVFSHQTALGFQNLGTRKRLGDLRATVIPYWGSAEEISKLYV